MAKSVNGGGGAGDDNENDTTPICRCRVLYLGSAVPHITKDGLQGIQEPLKDLYPEQGVLWNTDRDHNATGIDSWLSVWSNGILVENVDDKGNTIRRFHPIESLHYCAAVRYVSMPSNDSTLTKNGSTNESNNNNNKIAKFLPLDSPFSKSTSIDPMKMAHPPLFACILRRTSGIKVLECHAFICKKEAAANALVRCCFHAYADTMHAKQIELESPYEQLDRRRSRSIGSALDSQSLIDDKVNTWQKNSSSGGGGGESSTGSPDEANGFSDGKSMSRQKQQRTPSVASLVSHSMAAEHHYPPPPPHLYHGLSMMGVPEPIYGVPPTGTLRSVRSFISLAALKSHKKSRSRQISMPFANGLQPQPQFIHPPPPPPPVMFATLSKKELKKALKKESTLKRKHKYKDFPHPFVAANGYPAPPPPPFIYGPPPHVIHGPMPIYAPPVGPPSFYGTIDSRKGRIPSLPPQIAPPPPPPPPATMINDNGHMLSPPPPSSHIDEPIYMPAVPSPNGTLRPVTPHGEPIYFEGRPVNGPPIPIHSAQPGPMYMGQIHPQMVPCSLIPTLSRKELKELEKQKSLMKKQAKKEKKNAKKNKNQPQPMPPPPQQMMNGNGQLYIEEQPPGDYYQPRPYGYPPDEIGDPDESIVSPSEMQLSSGNYSNASNGGGGGIYKKKGHLNERAFSYSIRQEHRSRSNSLSNLAFENGSNNGNGRENESHNNSSVSLKSQNDAGHPNFNGPKMMNGNGSIPYEQQQQQQQQQQINNGNGRIPINNSHHNGGASMMMIDGNVPIDPNALATRMSNLNLKNGYVSNNNNVPPPPPPPLPQNGYHYQQRTATIKRL